ncbi:hypothetical protein N5J76_03180 [Pseudomonas sp. GD03855]|nr:hypothetical protein [Pseudomonas sp. GD03856]MDH2263922.1 hypothetical protein [Pseudomonas sp. GD03855]
MSKVLVDRDRVVESMCLTWRHDFGLYKLEGYDFCSGMTDKEREHLRGQMGKLFDHHFAPALSAVTAERDRLREEMAELWKRIDKFQSQSHGITALAEIERLRAEVEALRVALLGIASANPAERGIEWAKAYASDGLSGTGSELYIRWLEAFKEAEALRELLNKSLPVVEAHAGASHMLEGFRPIRNKWDELVDGIRAAMAAKEA